MLTVTDVWSTPPQPGWSVKDADTGLRISGGIPNELWQRWIAHRKENELPALTFAEMQDVFCRQLPPDCPTCGEPLVNIHAYPDLAEAAKVENMPITVWGPKLWEALHKRQISEDQRENERWMAAFTLSIPCNLGPRYCRQHFTEYLAKHSPDYSSQSAFRRWGWMAHNSVNQRAGKPQMSLEDARELYADTIPLLNA